VYDNGAYYHYTYDAAGERVLKVQSTGQRVFVNGQWKAGSGQMGNYTVYVNPYIVLRSGGYTKHYYIEGQRIVSKLGGGIDNNGKGPLQAGNGKVDYAARGQRVFDGIVKNLKFLGDDGQILTAGKSGKIPPGQVNGTGNVTEAFRYFYHPDHLGSTSYITDASGEVYQHLEYFAFGETFVEEHSNTNRTPWLFNGKELDGETGLYYYGARYYDARTSIWESVDALSDHHSGLSPYNYANNNPVIFIDPDGKLAMKWPPEFWEKHGTRIVGGLRALGGAAEMVAGGAAILVPEPTMVTKVVGVAAVVHGSDQFSSGLMQLITGQDQSTLTSQGLQAAGMSKDHADLVDAGVSIALTGGAGALAKTGQLSSAADATANAAKAGNNTVYVSKTADGVTQYAGITNNFARRAAEHLTTKGIKIEPLMQNLSRADARAVEQTLIEIHGLGKEGGTLLNKINSISKSNPTFGDQLKRGYELLKSIGYD
jgi:RHS repeat-associated protein